MAACGAGDTAAWARLYLLYDFRLAIWARRFHPPKEQEQDLRQDFWVFLLARRARKLSTYRVIDGPTFDSWLRVVYGNFCRAWLQRWSRYGNRMDLALPEEAPSVPPGAADPLRTLEITEYVRKLEPLPREVVLLWHQGFSHQEIARRCGISEANSWAILSRARSRLRGLRGEDG